MEVEALLVDPVSGLSGLFSADAHSELRIQINKTRRATLMCGNLTSNSRSEDSGVSARVYKKGFYGFSSSADCSSASCRAVLSAADANAGYFASRLISDKPALPPLQNGSLKTENDANDPEQSYYIDYIREIDRYISGKYPNLSSRTVTAYADSMEKILHVSNGFDSHSVLPRSYVYVTLTDNDTSGQPVEMFKPFGGFGTFDMNFSDPSVLYDGIDRLYEMLCDKKEAVYANAGFRTCILGPLMTGMLAHEAVGHTVEADIVLGGSVAGPNLGKTVASEKISMVDFAHTCLGKPAPLPVYVDDEGTKAEDAFLIDKGKLVGFMNSRETAVHFNMTPTGNARAWTFCDEPLIRMRNTAVLPGTDRLSDMIASVEDGYYLIDSGNGQADTTGEFMFGVTIGYEIKNGKIGKAIKDTTISGVAFDMLKTVDMVSEEMEWASSGFCGKKQPMPVGLGGPSIKCRVNIGGR
ncbi:MAG: TldD/PmbA family protein [Clostridia bacterium]|nr:TldD/PmbA family protein [Clostridia bacterium]